MNIPSIDSTMQRWIVNEPSVVSETVEGETIVINLETGCYYSLEGVAAECWEFLQRVGRDEAARIWMASHYAAEAEVLTSAWDEFVRELAKDQLIREIPIQGGGTDLPQAAEGSGLSSQPFVAPRIHKFEDMKEILLLDPIHEVSAGGWPSPA